MSDHIDNSNTQQQQFTMPEQPWAINVEGIENIGKYSFDDFVIECSMRLFAAANLDMYGAKNVNTVVKECVDRAILLAEQLHNRLSNKSNIYWKTYRLKNKLNNSDICENFCSQLQQQ